LPPAWDQLEQPLLFKNKKKVSDTDLVAISQDALSKVAVHLVFYSYIATKSYGPRLLSLSIEFYPSSRANVSTRFQDRSKIKW